jgi:hypothetical protein
MTILFEVNWQVAELEMPKTPINLQEPVATSGIKNSDGN